MRSSASSLSIGLEPGVLEHDFADQAVTVGMETARCQADDFVARPNGRAVDDSRSLDDADAEAGHIEIARTVNARHDGRLPAEQSHPRFHTTVRHAADEVGQALGIVAIHGDVIEKEERLGSEAQHVVDAHRHQIDADRVENRPSEAATFTFVPAPSVPETRTGSL